MRILFVSAVAAAVLASAGHAASPREIIATDIIEIRTGQARTFMFDEAVTKFSVSAEGIAQITPETDRTFTVQGLSPGQVLMTAYAQDGKVVHRSNILVDQAQGLVRIYGTSDSKDFIGYLCTDEGCGRADPDRVPLPDSTSTGESRQKGNAESITTPR
ncbi:pilus assembly protein N-terminal domain-containing protein [Bradyrhizobium sp. Tv2a-2]|uniref:pilus assembly protein N-terminal domain-containing protein n=1 Tax=Bradyrhizobium sp. Tv2a-2 TaxID=113395 RepID=UPI0004153335|nr:pilus assembly protein N-terminal domain-containing protein [Bradyrhizobium sp. Tv2a-2]